MTIAGRSIVVCRATHQAAPLLERLESLGALPIHVPLVEIVEPLDGGAEVREALASADESTWLTFTSANGVDAVARVLDGEAPAGRVAVVGGATADRAREFGWQVDFESPVATAAGLAASLPARSRAVAPLAELASTDLVDGLSSRGIEVKAVVAYRTVTPHVSSADVERMQSGDAVLITAPSVIRRLMQVLHPARVDAARSHAGSLPPLIAIGPTSATAIEQAGLSVADQASHPSVDGLIDALVRTLSE